MDRRSAIKNITLSFGTITLSTGTVSMIQSCQTNTADWKPRLFSLSEINFLDKVFEIIIPETRETFGAFDTPVYWPGAKELKLVRFVDSYIYQNIRIGEQKFLLSMMQDFINMILESEKINSVSDINEEIIEKYLSLHIDNGSIIANDGNNYSQICGLFREMTVQSYKSTEFVLTSKLGFVPIPGRYNGNVNV